MTALLQGDKRLGQDVELGFIDGRPNVILSLFWLRDHCQSPQAMHPETKQRLADTHGIPQDIDARSICLIEDGRALQIEWSHDGHVSRFEAEFLARLRADPEVLPVERTLWDRDGIAEQVPQVGYADYLAEDSVLKQALEMIERYGFCFVEGAPATPEATRSVAERVAYIRSTIFGGYYDFTANLEHKDTAYTSMAIMPHTDGTYSFDAPGYQIFHCLAAQCSGGENVLIDGFKLAQLMQERCPHDYQVLTEVEIPGQYVDYGRGIHLLARRPLFRLNGVGQLVQVSYNNHDRAPFLLPSALQRHFYQALTHFAALYAEPAMHYRRRLLPGPVLIFDNWRLLHARDAYTGYRRLAGAYLNKEDVDSRLRVLRMRCGEVE